MENLFTIAADCLHKADIERILVNTQRAWALHQQGCLDYEFKHQPAAVSNTQFPSQPILMPPQAMPRRKFSTNKGICAFFHALAHIEFVAIYLAWDMLYRFTAMPTQFYQDWLLVAYEESLHFTMLRKHLRAKGIDYGDLPAHQGLWDIAEQTADDLLARLALVPRYLEAHGLDVTPGMIDKFKQRDDQQSVAILSRILADEVGHVQRGSHWFKFVCQQRQLAPESTYRQLISSRLHGKPKGQLNRTLRLQAGFSEAELTWLESLR